MQDSQDTADRLAIPLERLARLGLRRPPGHSVERFLGVLVDGELLAARPVAHYVAAHQNTRYGGSPMDAEAVGPAADVLLQAIEAIVFLNGDLRRAVELERNALSRVKRGKNFYIKQLKRFEEALARPGADSP